MMKKLITILPLLFLLNCISRNSERYVLSDHTVILKGKFFRIDSANNIFVYHFKSDTIEAVFTSFNDKDFKSPNYKKIKLHKNYTLVLNREVRYANCFQPDSSEESYTENNILVWKTGMKSQYFVSCSNITANKINPRFTLLKYINPSPNNY
ncbi:hypothetical protein [Chryseobacterium sp. SIMBA_038]|uniref:hypothetical protein n=1 Tax=Chryseobacterium sp. SIMBA_038 TaxID=3085780 RepID=UPI00397E46FC